MSTIPTPTSPAYRRACSMVGSLTARHGSSSPEVAEARVERDTVGLELRLQNYVNSAPAPSPEQIDRLRRLLPAVVNA